MKNSLLLLISMSFIFSFYSQMNDCSDPIVNGCSSSEFVFSSVGDDFDDFPNSSVSSGCLFSGDNQMIYLVLTANNAGLLEWSVQGDADTGFMDWAIWPFDPNSPCSGLNAGTLAPLACCWNISSIGWAGMASPANIPVGAPTGNFQNPIMLSPGQTVLLGISNYNGSLDGQNITLSFFDENLITCVPQTLDQTICLGNTATVNILTPGLDSPQFNWLVTNAVSDITSGTNVLVNPVVTTQYQVAVHQAAIGSQIAFDTIIGFTITVMNPPTPNAGSDQILCSGDPIQLIGTASNATDTLSWTSFFTGSTTVPTVSYTPNSSSLVPAVTVSELGLYSFVLHETNNVCPSETDTCQIVVVEVTQTLSKSDPLCNGSSDGEIHITSVLGTEFSIDNGATWQFSPYFTGLTAGTYTVCSKNNLGCEKCNSITLVNPAPVVIDVSSDTLICQNGSATLIASAAGGTNYLYHWDMTTSNLNSQIVAPLINTSYTVFVENQNGCFSIPKTINVTIRPELNGTITPNDTICSYDSKELEATATGGIAPYEFEWNTSEITNGLTSSIHVTTSISKTYSVKISDGCETTPIYLFDTLIVEEIVNPTFICDNDKKCESAIFEINNTTNSIFLDHISWEISDGNSFGNENTITTGEMSAGTYSVKLNTFSKEGCVNSLLINNFLISYPKPEAIFAYSPNPVKMFNTDVQFGNSSIGAISYQWSFEAGNPSASALETPKVLFPDGVAGEYEVTLIAMSEHYCVDTTRLNVIVIEDMLVYAPNTFTPDGDSFNQTWKLVVAGIDLTVFDLFIYDRWGEKIWESHDLNDSWSGVYQGKNVPEGTYTWTLKVKDVVNDSKYYYKGHINLLR